MLLTMTRALAIVALLVGSVGVRTQGDALPLADCPHTGVAPSCHIDETPLCVCARAPNAASVTCEWQCTKKP